MRREGGRGGGGGREGGREEGGEGERGMIIIRKGREETSKKYGK